MTAKIRKGDNVVVLSGKDKGKNGKVLKIIRSKVDSRVKAVVEGVNVVKKHMKQSATSKGGIESKELPIHLCKLSIVDPKTSKPTRVGIKTLEDGKKVLKEVKKLLENNKYVVKVAYGNNYNSLKYI